MIILPRKIQLDGLLKEGGKLLDLGCGDARATLPFVQLGYHATLIDQDPNAILNAKETFKTAPKESYEVIESSIEDFEFVGKYDAVIFSNVLPFLSNKDKVVEILNRTWDSLNEGGFLFFTLFGDKDQWAVERKDTMIFYSKDEALSLIEKDPYFMSEDFGKGATKSSGIKTWHQFSLIYLK